MKNLIFVALLSLFLVSCGISKRDFDVRPTVKVQDNFLTEGDSNVVFAASETTKDWWAEFEDPILDTLIEKARNHNLDINTAIANFYASRAYLKEAKFDRFPTVTANGDYNRTRLGENIFVQGSNPTYSTYNGSFDAFWEADLFGRVTNRIKGADASQLLALADMQAAYVSIFAEVANDYME